MVYKACAAIGMTRQQVYVWRRDMPDFARDWDEALKIGVTALEDEAHRRAFEGVQEPLVHKGQFTYQVEDVLGEDGQPVISEATLEPVRRIRRDKDGNPMVATVTKASDTLAIFLLKAHNPEKYRDNSRVEMAGSLDLRHVSEDEIDQELAELAQLEAARAAALAKTITAPDSFDDLV
jgi:hypothetical protein